MPKYNVLVDTNIYRQSPRRADLPFRALERLCQAGVAKLHLPYIVEREFQTQQVALHAKDLDAAVGAIDSLLKRGLSEGNANRLDAIRAEIAALAPGIKEEAEGSLGAWADNINVERHPITEEAANNAMEAYFRGDPPLVEAKTRADIPDSFIFQVIRSLSQSEIPLIVNCADGKLADAATGLPNVTVFRTLADFVASPNVQADILELDVVDNLPDVAGVVEAYEKETNALSNEVENSGGKKLVWEKIHSHTIPDDNHEATITSYWDPEDVEFDFVDLSYFGAGKFGLPFTCTARVQGTYYIFKSDWYAMEKHISVTDHNDHYFEAEEEFEIRVSGTLRVEIAPADVASITAENFEDHATWEIDSIDKIELMHEDE